jgi:tellurite resistance protein
MNTPPPMPFEHNIAGFERLQYFPVMMFTITMGLAGLSLAYQKAHHVLEIPILIGNALAYVSLILFMLISAMYMLKSARYPTQVKNEFTHPLRLHFFAAISISMLLLAAAFQDLNSGIAAKLWYGGALMQLILTLYTISFWINRNLEIQHSSPVWFLPVVGNMVVPLAGSAYAPLSVSLFFFASGMFLWLALFSLILNRTIFHHQLPEKFVPTLFIFIAPPAVAFIAYYKLSANYDMLAQSFYSVALFFTLLLTFMFRRFVHLKFFISWWAFTFPLAAMTVATLMSFELSHSDFFKQFSYIMLGITTVVILIVAVRTLEHMWRGEICVMEQ